MRPAGISRKWRRSRAGSHPAMATSLPAWRTSRCAGTATITASTISATSSTPAIVTPASASGLKAPPSPTSARAAAQRRRLSDLIQTPAQAIGSARDSFFDTADQSIKNITNSLGDSYKFWLGKIREDSKELVVPKTLEDARKLIGTPPPDDDDTLDTSSSSRRLAEHDALTPGREDRMLSLVGGRKASIASRDRSADSTRRARSASSSKKVVFSEDNKEKTAGSAANPLGISQPVTPSLVDQARNLGNSLNPMNKFSGMIRPFGRSVTTPVPSSSTPPPKDAAGKPVDGGDLATVSFSFSSISTLSFKRSHANRLNFSRHFRILQQHCLRKRSRFHRLNHPTRDL